MYARIHLMKGPNLNVFEPEITIRFEGLLRYPLLETDLTIPGSICVTIATVHRHGDKGVYFEGTCNGHEVVGHFWPGNIKKSWVTTDSRQTTELANAA